MPAARRAAAAVVVLLAVCGVRGVDVGCAVPTRPPAVAAGMLLGSSARVTSFGVEAKGAEMGGGGGRQLAGADDEDEDYGYVDPPPDTNRRGAGAPIPHN
jgi:hypothetical protein